MAINTTKIPSGYKQTKIGIIPEDWEVKKLGEVTQKVGSGITPKGGEKVYKEEGRFFLRSQNIGWGNLLLNDVAFINEETHNTFKGTELEFNDVLLNITGASIGRSAIVTKEIVGGNVNQHVCIIRPTKCLIPKYLNSFLISPKGQKSIYSFQAGGNRQGLNFEQIKSFQIPLPPLPEQRVIAACLSTWDKAIDKTQKLIEQLKQRNKGLMQQLLTGKMRLKDENGKRFCGEWKERKLGEIGLISSAGVDKKIIESEVPVRLLNYLDVYRRNFIYDNELSHCVTAKESKKKKCSIKKGDIFFTPSSEVPNDIAISAVAMENIKNGVYSYHIVRLRLEDNWSLRYKGYAFKTGNFFKQAQRLCDGSGQRYVISQKSFNSIKVKVPPIQEQRAIGTVLFEADKEVQLQEGKLTALKEQKKGLMQVLLTGKVRLKIFNEDGKEAL